MMSSLAVAVFSAFRWQWKYQLVWSIMSFVICKNRKINLLKIYEDKIAEDLG